MGDERLIKIMDDAWWEPAERAGPDRMVAALAAARAAGYTVAEPGDSVISMGTEEKLACNWIMERLGITNKAELFRQALKALYVNACGAVVLSPDGPEWPEAVERARQSIINGSGGMIHPGFDCMDAAIRAAAPQKETDG